jgi:4-hydroxy-tetrahydrodipicolinate reductase
MSSPADIIVCGAAGRMGRRIVALAHADPRVCVAGAIEASGHPNLGADAGTLAGVGPTGVVVGSDLAALAGPGKVVVDFTAPDASLAHLEIAVAKQSAIVIGSTGFDAESRARLERLAPKAATLIAANMSVGVNVLLGLVEEATRRLGPAFDCEIVELHHGRKKDAPSGTALALGEAAARGKGLDPARALRLERSGITGERPAGEIGVMALRGGDNVGEHSVLLVGTGERLELVHRAASRDCLASGAIHAAAWLAGRTPGLYSMRDVLFG